MITWATVTRLVTLSLLSAGLAVAGQASYTMNAPTFGSVTIYPAAGQPRQVVLFISGDGGWNLGVVPMAERLRDAGALVVGIDIRTFVKNLDASGSCSYPAGALEELSRAVQLREKLPAYKRPILVGYSSGATLVYAALAAAPSETFAGAISLGFCPDLEVRTPPCLMRGLKASKKTKSVGFVLEPYPGSTVPWMVLQGEVDQVCAPSTTRAFVTATGAARLFSLPKVGHGFGVPANWEPQFVDAYHVIADTASAEATREPATSEVADLSLVEVPSTGMGHGDTMAVVLTGDGGWAEIDKSLAAQLSAAGIPTVGWSSLDYYWSPRTPERASEDLARIIQHYTAAWSRTRVIVIGYSFGADVAPFLVNRLSDRARTRIARVALLSPSPTAAFEFHLASWLGGGGDRRYPTLPEIEKIGATLTCIYAADESDSVCQKATNPRMRSTVVGRGHHFGGDYARLVELILR